MRREGPPSAPLRAGDQHGVDRVGDPGLCRRAHRLRRLLPHPGDVPIAHSRRLLQGFTAPHRAEGRLSRDGRPPASRFLWSVDNATKVATAKNYEPLKRPRRQDWDGELIENGAFYLFTKSNWEQHKCRLGGKSVLYEMEEHTFTELDSLVDWKVVSHMAADYGYFPAGAKPPRPFGAGASCGAAGVGIL